jgi:4-oxalocrotonate tautomerase
MPMITVQIANEPDVALARRVQQTITSLTSELLGKDPAVTAITIDFIPRKFWFIGGKSAEELPTGAFFVDVRITDGTNSKDEKARYIGETFAALSSLLGDVHPESYVHVDDVRADGYGYGGLTQERRYIQGRVATKPAA